MHALHRKLGKRHTRSYCGFVPASRREDIGKDDGGNRCSEALWIDINYPIPLVSNVSAINTRIDWKLVVEC